MCKDRSVTSIVNSAAHVAHDRCACGNPLLLSLSPSDVKGESGRQRIRQIVESYFKQGGFHLHFNIVNAAQLREARKNPQAHPDLTVRISGFSARFTALDGAIQDALIERTEMGM
ncbi:MAG: hypothetical protein FJ279_06485 [Planctomycetes bacterium]|nr:hypothetical protein [Planctomycetota bacterium]